MPYRNLQYETSLANSVDIVVGQNIRLLRMRTKLSQKHLASKIGVTFQQVQKYEKGTNRVGASRLSMIADVLQVPITSLFDGADGKASESERLFRTLMAEPDVLKLVQAFSAIPSNKVRNAVVKMVETISTSNKSGKQP